MALNRVAIPSPNYSSRGGSSVRIIVVHTAEGARTIESLGNFFANPASGVSSHAGIDDKANTIGVYVHRADKAWTAANANPVAVQAELCAFAAWDNAEWHRHPNMLANCAAWIAEEAAVFGIPIVKLNAAQAQGGGRGVCQHIDLGAWGGGHVDCGPGFPMDEVLAMAAGGAPGSIPGPIPPGVAPPDFFEGEQVVTIGLTVEDGKVWYIAPGVLRHLNTEEWSSFEAAGYELKEMNARQKDVLASMYNLQLQAITYPAGSAVMGADPNEPDSSAPMTGGT